MRIALAAVFAAVTLAAVPMAEAGGYLAVGVGQNARLDGDLGAHFTSADESAGRIALGTRKGPWALEASLFGTDLRAVSNHIRDATTGDGTDFSTMSLGVDVKYHVGLLGPIEGYVRGGLNKTWLVAGAGLETTHEYAGRGYDLGGGLQWGFRLVPAVQAAVWLDYTHQVMRLRDPVSRDIDGSAGLLTLGLSVGTSL